MSDLITVHEHNPDPMFGTCRVFGYEEHGVVFESIEPAAGWYTFVGETALLEALAKLHNITITDLRRALGHGTQAQEKKLARERGRADTAEAEVARLQGLITELTEAAGGADGS